MLKLSTHISFEENSVPQTPFCSPCPASFLSQQQPTTEELKIEESHLLVKKTKFSANLLECTDLNDGSLECIPESPSSPSVAATVTPKIATKFYAVQMTEGGAQDYIISEDDLYIDRISRFDSLSGKVKPKLRHEGDGTSLL
jgi:hypothetical protein